MSFFLKEKSEGGGRKILFGLQQMPTLNIYVLKTFLFGDTAEVFQEFIFFLDQGICCISLIVLRGIIFHSHPMIPIMQYDTPLLPNH